MESEEECYEKGAADGVSWMGDMAGMVVWIDYCFCTYILYKIRVWKITGGNTGTLSCSRNYGWKINVFVGSAH